MRTIADTKEKEFLDFVQNRVYWYGEQRTSFNLAAVLQYILAKRTPSVEARAREQFGLTDEDFREALKTTPPGLFTSEAHWKKVTHRFGLDLPFPKFDLEKEREELRLYKERKKARQIALQR